MIIYDNVQGFRQTDDQDTVWSAAISCRAFVHGLVCMRMEGLTMKSPLGDGSFDLRRSAGFMLQGLSGLSR